MKQQVDAKARQARRPSAHRAVLLQRMVSHVIRSAQEHMSLRQQIVGWSIVVGIFAAAATCWGVVVVAAL
ncbi:MAG TPA: hypothetical protein VKQ29_14575 [Aliidongia sp.]|nr:hypothetical protein [Aliidongia sp.]